MNGAPAPSYKSLLTVALVALTAATGMIDAVSYLGLGHVFTANMTGNVVLLGFGLAGASGLPVLAPIVSLLAFLAGAVAGGRLARRYAAESRLIRVALSVETALLACGIVVAAATAVRPGTVAAYAVIALLAIAMGLRNAVVRTLSVQGITTTVLTLTLTGLAADSRAAGGAGGGAKRAWAVLAMGVGALVGALAELQSVTWGLVAATATTAVTLGAYVAAVRRGVAPAGV